MPCIIDTLFLHMQQNIIVLEYSGKWESNFAVALPRVPHPAVILEDRVCSGKTFRTINKRIILKSMKGALNNKKGSGNKASAGSKYLSIFGFLLMVYAFVYFVMDSKDTASEKEKALVTTVHNEPVVTVISDEAAVASVMLEGMKVGLAEVFL